MTLYIAVSLSLTLPSIHPARHTGTGCYRLRLLGWPDLANLIAVGVLAGIITTLIVYLFGQSRIFFAVSRDGLLPQHLCKIHDTYHTPYLITIVGSIVIAIISGFVPLMHIVELSNTGTLAVFLINFIGIVAMRRNHPEIPRKFRCPILPIIAPIGVIVCFYLIYELSPLTHMLFIGWLVLGLIIYYATAAATVFLINKV